MEETSKYTCQPKGATGKPICTGVREGAEGCLSKNQRVGSILCKGYNSEQMRCVAADLATNEVCAAALAARWPAELQGQVKDRSRL